MNYKEYGYKEFMDKISDGTYAVTELELRENKCVSSTRRLMGTHESDYQFPIETARYYDICIYYIDMEKFLKDHKISYLCDDIAFSAPSPEMHNEADCLAKAKEIYGLLLKKLYRVSKSEVKNETCRN